MRRVSRVAQEDDLAVSPALAAHGGEGAPHGAVREQLVSLELLFEELAAVSDRVRLARALKTSRLEGLLAALDDPGRGLTVEGVGVDREQAVLVLLEDEGEGLEGLGRAEPAELALAPVCGGLEDVGVALTDRAVHPVGCDDEVVVVVGLELIDLDSELQLDPELSAAVVEDVQELLARETAEAVPSGERSPAWVEGLDVAPVGEVGADLTEALGVGLLEAGEGLVAEDDPPAEGVVGLVALDDADLCLREGLLQEDPGVEAPGAAAENSEENSSARSALEFSESVPPTPGPSLGPMGPPQARWVSGGAHR